MQLRKCLKLSAYLILALSLAAIGYGQETWGSVRGTVTDPSGAAIPGAKVDLTGPTMPQGISMVTDAAGQFQFRQVPPGTGYAVSVTAQGFRNSKASNLAVVLGKATSLDVKLEVGQVTESVVVAADAILVDTQSSSSAVTVDKSFFDLIPKGRSFYDLVAIAPGARNESKTGGYQVDGASGSENTYYLDGMEVTNIQTGVLSDKNRVPVEMVQQLQIKNGVMDAQYGGAMGGVVNAVVRSGSNDFHGEAGFYYWNDNMSARPRPSLQTIDNLDASRTRYTYFQNTNDDYSTWNPIFSLGGPLIKNRVFFFAGYMPTKTDTTRTVLFNSTGKSSTFTQKDVQQNVAGKVDVVPWSKLRLGMSWVWNPSYTRGNLPARDGTSDPNRPWSGLGSYSAGQILTGQADFLATSKLVFSFRGGYNRTNSTNRYSLTDTTFIYSTANTMFSDIPADLRRTSTGWVQQGTSRQDFDIYTRVNLNADVSYMLNWFGQHNLKGGYQTNQLSNSVQNLTYPSGYYRFYWNQAYPCVTSQCSGQQRGTYGYYRWYTYGDFGDASSENQGYFIQDTWRMNKNLTLNLGLRMEREFLPSFAKAGIAAAPPIEFGWGEKISPRLGFAWDPKGDGKMKFYGGWGNFFDIMKYEMPRGSFGGALYITNFYSIDDPNIMRTLMTYGYPQGDPKTAKLPGRFFESVDWRIPSNDPQSCEKQGLDCKGMTIDPNLKPMKQRMIDFGYDFSISSSLVASARYTNRRLIRTIEDIGTLGAGGEVYFIANPGEGIVADPKTWEAGIPTTPKAVRKYDALELRLDKRFSTRYQFAASYTFSKQRGNYSGLASSDEDGRTSPNVNRYFDLPWLGLTEQGVLAEGPLATDRPHTFKFFGGYTMKSLLGNTTISPNFFAYSGIPITTQFDAISTVPVYPYGRGDMGRTPIYANLDLNLMHDFAPFKARESMRVRFEFTVFNLLNSSTVTNIYSTLLHEDTPRVQFAHDADIFKGFNSQQLITSQKLLKAPAYGAPSAFQGPRSARMQLSFIF